MGEIFRMQLAQILGGKTKWLVVLCLSLPVLLTFAASQVGGIAVFQEEIVGEQRWDNLRRGILPETAQRVVWEGEDRIIGPAKLTEEGVLVPNPRFFWRPLDEQPIDTLDLDLDLVDDNQVIYWHGYVLVLNGELWIDPTREDTLDRRVFISSRRNVDFEPAPVDSDPEVTRELISAIFLFLTYPQTICLLLALFYGTSVLGSELGGKTLTYLFTRPLPRWRFVVGKYLGIVTAVIIPTCLSVLASWLILGAEGGAAQILALLIATAGALLGYNALFVLFGFLVPRRAMIVALLYGIVFELALSFVPALVNQFTVTYYLRSVVVEMLDLEIPREAVRVVGGASISTSCLALGAIIACALGLSSLLAARREYVIADQA